MTPHHHFGLSLTGLHGCPNHQTLTYGHYHQAWLQGWVLVTLIKEGYKDAPWSAPVELYQGHPTEW